MTITKHTNEQEAITKGECAKGKTCDNCRHGCRMSSGCLSSEDIPRIAKFLEMTEDELKEQYLEPVTKFNTTLYRPKIIRQEGKPYGKCIFFDEERSCTIHAAKPKECKVSNCNHEGEALSLWFTLNHFVNACDPQSVREYAAYLESGGKTLPGGALHELVKDKETLKKMLSGKMLR